MKERELKFITNTDETLVKDEDGKKLKVVRKLYSEIQLNLGYCYEQLQKGKLTEGMKETHLSLTEHYVTECLKKLGYASILEKEQEERNRDIRYLNNENRELRRQLGEKVSNEDLREKLKNIESAFYKWWSIKGFGHASEIGFNSVGSLTAELSGGPAYRFREKVS